jgi:hypothetical protein
MLNLILNRHDPVKIGDFEIEVTIREQHSYSNEVTDYPIEDGMNISDFIQQRPERITIEGLVSRNPLPTTVGVEEFILGSGYNRTQNALETLLDIAGYRLPKQVGQTIIVEKAGAPKIIDIVSLLRIYTNMVCTSLTIPYNQNNGQALRFSMDFKHIATVTSKIVAIDRVNNLDGKAPNIENVGPKTKSAGVQKTSTPTVANRALDSTLDFYENLPFFKGGN